MCFEGCALGLSDAIFSEPCRPSRWVNMMCSDLAEKIFLARRVNYLPWFPWKWELGGQYAASSADIIVFQRLRQAQF